jgi:hypothetical protein
MAFKNVTPGYLPPAADKIITVHIGYNSVNIGKEIWKQYKEEYMSAPSVPKKAAPTATKTPAPKKTSGGNESSPAQNVKASIQKEEDYFNDDFNAEDDDDDEKSPRDITTSAKPNPLLDSKGEPRAVYVGDKTEISDIMENIKTLADCILPCFNIIADLDSPKYYDVLSAIKYRYKEAIILNICIIPATTRVINPAVDNLILYNIAAISNFTYSTILIDYDTVTKGMNTDNSTRIYTDDVVNKMADILSYYIHVMFVNESTRQTPNEIAKNISTTQGIATLAYVDDAENPVQMAQKLTTDYLVKFEKSTIVYRYVICENKRTLKNIDNEPNIVIGSLSTKHNKEFRRNYRRSDVTGRRGGRGGGSTGRGGAVRQDRLDSGGGKGKDVAVEAVLTEEPVVVKKSTSPLPPPRGLTIVIDTGIKIFFENLKRQLKINTNKLLNDILKAVAVFGDSEKFSELINKKIDFDSVTVPDLAKTNSGLQDLVGKVKDMIDYAITAIMKNPNATRRDIDDITYAWFNNIYNEITINNPPLHDTASNMGLSDAKAGMRIDGILYYDAPPTNGVNSQEQSFEIQLRKALGDGSRENVTLSQPLVKDYANLIIFLILKNVDIATNDPLRIKAIIHLLLATLNKAPSNSKMFMFKLVRQLEAINKVDLEVLRLGELDRQRVKELANQGQGPPSRGLGGGRGGATPSQPHPAQVLSKVYTFTSFSAES